MFEEMEWTRIRAQLGRRKALVLLPLLAPLAVIAAALIIRAGAQADTVAAMHDPVVMRRITGCEWAAAVAGILGIVWLIFGWDLLVSPVKHYASFLDGMLHGPEHTVTGRWAGISGDLSVVDGVSLRSVSLTVTDEKGRDYERRFYWDAEKEIPVIPLGTETEVTFHGKAVKSVRTAAV